MGRIFNMNFSQEDRVELAQTIKNAALFYGKTDITKESVIQMLNVFEQFFNYPAAQIKKAFHDYILDSKNKFFPSPASLRPYIEPEIDSDSLAVVATSRVIEAVSKFGYNNSTEAREYIGELGWRAVKSFNGWLYVCENLGINISITTFSAQVRDLSKSIIKMDKLGIKDGPIQIGKNQKSPDMLLGDNKNEQILKFIDFLKKPEIAKT